MKRVAFFLATFLLTSTFQRLNAQAAPATGVQDTTLAIDEWILRPRPILLSTSQRLVYDTLRSRFAEEWLRIRTGADDALGLVAKALALHVKYRGRVRAILTLEQQSVFDANFAASRLSN